MANSAQFFDPFFLLDKLTEENNPSAPPPQTINDAPDDSSSSGAWISNDIPILRSVAAYIQNAPGEDDNTHISTAYGTTSFRFNDLVDLWPQGDHDITSTEPGGADSDEQPWRPFVPAPDGNLQILGQGTIAVKAKIQDSLEIVVHTDEPVETRTTLGIRVTAGNVDFYSMKQGMKLPLPFEARKPIEEARLDVDVETTYWLSIDKENGRIRYGKYWAHTNLTCLEANYKYPNAKGELVWRDQKDKWIGKLKDLEVIQDGDNDTPPRMVIQPVAVVIDESPFIVSSDSVTLGQLESGKVIVPANLPEACQRLYGNVAGKQIVLNDEDFPDFTNAIEMSCRNEKGWCHERLVTKANGGNLHATYLRITLGYNYGDSPGVPYVLEIWPAQHFSSVHDHGDAAAIIKVLSGEINATYYDTLHKRKPAVIGTAKFEEGQITWISPRRFQVHKLHNSSERVCCTIQCYRYELQDNKHYEAFRFQDGSGVVKDFTPNSDMSYTVFRERMETEWKEYGAEMYREFMAKESANNAQA